MSKTDGAAVKHIEQTKYTLYRADPKTHKPKANTRLQAQDLLYATCAEVAGGRWGPGATAALRVASEAADTFGRSSKARFRSYWSKRLSMSLQRAAMRKIKLIYDSSIYDDDMAAPRAVGDDERDLWS